MKKNPFIVLEGLSGVGKTSVGKLLAKKLKAAFYSTPSGHFAKIREIIHSTNNLQFLYHFYLASLVHASIEIEKLLNKKPVICVRFLLTTRCYYKALGLNQKIDCSKLPILEPDFVFLLTCNAATKNKRLDQRGRSKHDKEEGKPGLAEKILKEYRKHKVIGIDTTNLSIKEIADTIIKYLS